MGVVYKSEDIRLGRDVAEVLGVSLATVNRDLTWAKDWLNSELRRAS